MHTKTNENLQIQIGQVCFIDFEAAFQALQHQHKNVFFTHPWFIEWKHQHMNNSVVDAMLNALNSDCVCKVFEYLGPIEELFIRKRSKIIPNLTKFSITKDSVGVIGIMNLQYLLFEFGTDFTELVVCASAFKSSFGLCPYNTRFNVLFLINKLAKNLKRLSLIGFRINYEPDNSMDGAKFHTVIDSMEARGIEIEYDY